MNGLKRGQDGSSKIREEVFAKMEVEMMFMWTRLVVMTRSDHILDIF